MAPIRPVFFLAALFAAHSLEAQFAEQGLKLVGSGARGSVFQGISVAVSADGNTAIVGGYYDNGGIGAAWVYSRSGSVWSQQGSKLVGSGASGLAHQGSSVSLSGDGNTAIVGGYTDGSGIGAAWVFTRAGGLWTQQGAKLVGTDRVGSSSQGGSVSLSRDGNTAIVGGRSDSGGAGAAWVFTRSGGVWSQQGSKLVGTGAVGSANQGGSVSLSVDGNTAIVGGSGDNGGVGAAWAFTRAGGVWTQQGTKLVGTDVVGSAGGGGSVSLSGDGNTAMLGGAGDNGGVGAAWVFTRSAGIWTQHGPKLVGTGGSGIALQGRSVSLSTDGNTAMVGGDSDLGGGATWVFTQSAGVWAQQGAKLVGSGAVGLAGQGWSVSVSADGNTAVVGGNEDDSAIGAAWVFTRSGSVWSQEGDKLVGSNAVGFARQGISVALSGDGNTAMVGGFRDSELAGAAWVFTRNGFVWTQLGTKLVGTGAGGRARQGFSVALSADGSTAIVGGPEDSLHGAAWIFTLGGGAWSQQGEKLAASDAAGQAKQGASVAISADGNTAVVGGWGDNGNVGAAWVYTRSGDVWTQQGTKLAGWDAVGSAKQGTSVAISADGNTVLLGGPGDATTAGAAWVFTRTGGVWTQQGTKLVGAGALGPASQGSSVSLSADGNTAMLGGFADDGTVGATWVFTRSWGAWTQQGAKLVGTGAVVSGAVHQGTSVSLAADGNTAMVGGSGDNGSVGATWVFTRSGSVWTQQGSKLVGILAVGPASQGGSVALSADGTTGIVGGSTDQGMIGAAWVFASRPTANVSGGGAICDGSGSALIQADLWGVPPFTVTWSDGYVQEGLSEPLAWESVSPLTNTVYTITSITNPQGVGSAAGSALVTVGPTPATPTPSSNSPICAGATLNLQSPAVIGATYSWTGPDGFSSVAQNTSLPSAGGAAAGTYSVTVTVNGCTSAAGTTNVVVNPDSAPPVVTPPDAITADQSSCCGAFGGATGSASAAVTSFLAGGTAMDDCDAAPSRLAAQVGGLDATSATCFEAGKTNVSFRFRDSSGKNGSATSTVTVRMFGDLNVDNGVDPSDMVVLRAFFNFAVSPGTPPFDAPLGMADLTHEGTVDPSDMVVMRAYFNFAVGCLAP